MTKSINWAEGTFIQPHHFQQAFLDLEERQHALVADYFPHPYGITQLEVAPCDTYTFEILRLDCRLPDGTRILGGTRVAEPNAKIETREFREQFEAAQNRLSVYLGLPKLQYSQKNCLRFDEERLGGKRYRYISEEDTVPDLISGENQRVVEHKLYRPQLLFRWKVRDGESGDSMDGYETLKLAELELGAQKGEYKSSPQLRAEYVPPCTSLLASPLLSRYFGELQSRLNAKHLNLRDYWKHKDTATVMKTRDTFKVQAVTAAALGLRQFGTIKRLHPFTLYVKLAEIMGTLSIYTPDDSLIAVPDYNHDNLGDCYARMHEKLEKLLALLEEVIYEDRLFQAKSTDLLACPMEQAWLDDKRELFICFDSPLSELEVVQSVAGLKVASEDIIPLLNEKRLYGVKLEGPVHHLTNLPSGPTRHYFKLPRDTTFFPKLKEFPTLAIWGRQFAELVRLFVVDKEKL